MSAGRPLHVACAVQPEYMPHFAAMVDSVLEHADASRVHVSCLCRPTFPRRGARKLRAMVEARDASIAFVGIADEMVRGLPTSGYTGTATWYRTLAPEVLPDASRVIFLDADLIALASLAPLWEASLEGNFLAAVSNVFQPDHVGHLERLGLAHGEYFNAGVLVMDLDRMRADGCTAAVLSYARSRAGELWLRDQDALNVVLGHRRLALHPRWNLMNSMLSFPAAKEVLGPGPLAAAVRDPAIRHFEGPSVNKPWHFECRQPMRELYIAHRRRTPWPRVKLEGRWRPRALGRRVRRALLPAGRRRC